MLVFVRKAGVLEEEELLRMVDIEFIKKKHFVEGFEVGEQTQKPDEPGQVPGC